jgi:hypothetical protein
MTDDNPNHVTSPGKRRTSNRREALQKVYASKEWGEASDEFLGNRRFTIKGIIRGEGLQVGEPGYLLGETQYWYENKKPCKWHLETDRPVEVKVGTLAHHPYYESYKDGNYLDLYLSGCMVLCNSCHYSLHHGLVLCKRCGVHYHRVGADCCKSCWLELHPEVTLAKWKRDILMKLKKRLASDAQVVLRREWKKNSLGNKKPKVKSSSKNHPNKDNNDTTRKIDDGVIRCSLEG